MSQAWEFYGILLLCMESVHVHLVGLGLEHT